MLVKRRYRSENLERRCEEDIRKNKTESIPDAGIHFLPDCTNHCEQKKKKTPLDYTHTHTQVLGQWSSFLKYQKWPLPWEKASPFFFSGWTPLCCTVLDKSLSAPSGVERQETGNTQAAAGTHTFVCSDKHGDGKKELLDPKRILRKPNKQGTYPQLWSKVLTFIDLYCLLQNALHIKPGGGVFLFTPKRRYTSNYITKNAPSRRWIWIQERRPAHSGQLIRTYLCKNTN